MTESEFRKGKLCAATDVLAELLKRLGLEHRLKENRLLSKWASVVGPNVAAATKAEKITDGVLLVLCKSSAWASELSLYKNEIMERLNAAAGEQLVRDMRFSTRGYRGTPDADGVVRRADVRREPAVEKADVECARRIASICTDPELAKTVERAVLAARRYRRTEQQSGPEVRDDGGMDRADSEDR